MSGICCVQFGLPDMSSIHKATRKKLHLELCRPGGEVQSLRRNKSAVTIERHLPSRMAVWICVLYAKIHTSFSPTFILAYYDFCSRAFVDSFFQAFLDVVYEHDKIIIAGVTMQERMTGRGKSDITMATVKPWRIAKWARNYFLHKKRITGRRVDLRH